MLDFTDYTFALATMVCTTALLAIGTVTGFVAGQRSRTRWIVREIAESAPIKSNSGELIEDIHHLRKSQFSQFSHVIRLLFLNPTASKETLKSTHK